MTPSRPTRWKVLGSGTCTPTRPDGRRYWEIGGAPTPSPSMPPAAAEDLSGLPPAYVECTSVETFRDEDVAYANRIWRAGGVCDLHVGGWISRCRGHGP